MRSVRTWSARWLACAAAVLLVGVATPEVARAQGNSANISGNLGVDFSNAYFYRGIRQEREGLVLQPYADVSFSLFEKGDQRGPSQRRFHPGSCGTASTRVRQGRRLGAPPRMFAPGTSRTYSQGSRSALTTGRLGLHTRRI